MNLREAITRVLELQNDYSSKNTPQMKERGELIRHTIPDFLRASELEAAFSNTVDDISFEGRDGTGLKNEVPWVRCYSASRSPSATTGWYWVLLFDADGRKCGLSLSHGSTRFMDGEYKPREEKEVLSLMSWARQALQSVGFSISDLEMGPVNLGGRSKITRAYEKTIVTARLYDVHSIPDDSVLVEELRRFSKLLSHLYLLSDTGYSPESQNPIIQQAEQLIENYSRPNTQNGQGFGLTFHERKCIELHAMKLAEDYLTSRGFETIDRSAKHPYDLEARKAGVTLTVEVKGSTGPLSQILLTKNEVAHHRQSYPHNMVIIVDDIRLDRSKAQPEAAGGAIRAISPWQIVDENLLPIAYRYML